MQVWYGRLVLLMRIARLQLAVVRYYAAVHNQLAAATGNTVLEIERLPAIVNGEYRAQVVQYAVVDVQAIVKRAVLMPDPTAPNVRFVAAKLIH